MSDDHRAAFNNIYEQNLWGYGSGPGSMLPNTQPYINFLTNFIRSNNIEKVLDVGCGDWQLSSLIDWSGIEYIGIDVSSVVLSNTKKYAKSGISFLELNAVSEDLPEADLLVMKDVIQHWSNDDIITFIPKLKKIPRALITNDLYPNDIPNCNRDIPVGSWRPVSLEKAPFNVKGNYVFVYEGGNRKGVFLWTL